MPKLPNDLAVAVNYFFLHLKSELPSRLGRIPEALLVEYLQRFANLWVGIRSRKNAGYSIGQRIGPGSSFSS